MNLLTSLALAAVVAVATAWAALRLRAAIRRARGRRARVELTCPKRTTRVECLLVVDDDRGEVLGVDECSAFGVHARPRCSLSCAWILNQGLPLDTRSLEERSSDDHVRLPLA
jgi:hypothetical protein